MAKKKANKKAQKEVKKQAKKLAKKHPILTVIIILLVVAIVGCCVLHTQGIVHIPFLDGIFSDEEKHNHEQTQSQGGAFTAEDITAIKSSDLSIHFLMLGNEYTGDSTLIKVGDTEVLIDAGSIQASAGTLVPYIQDYCTDGILEYVIVTHADQDHIAGFVGTTIYPGIFESFDCKTIIDFPLTDKDTQIYERYCEERDAEVALGAKHYTALECWNNTGGAQRSYALSDKVTMNFLYQKFYEERTEDENDYSVCMLLEDGTNNYLFTGDLEKDGEQSLIESNTLPKCKLFKAGHHGSKTSSTTALLEIIQPEIVCVCCCCGSDEYTKDVANQFPTQDFVNRVAPYTEQVYVTTIVADNEEGFAPLNGNIVITSKDGEVLIRCSNNATLFKDTDWFKNNRTCPSAWQ